MEGTPVVVVLNKSPDAKLARLTPLSRTTVAARELEVVTSPLRFPEEVTVLAVAAIGICPAVIPDRLPLAVTVIAGVVVGLVTLHPVTHETFVTVPEPAAPLTFEPGI
jgi:hypothetical protein